MKHPPRKRPSRCIIPRDYRCRAHARHPAAGRWFGPTGAVIVPHSLESNLRTFTAPNTTREALERTIERAMAELPASHRASAINALREPRLVHEVTAGVLRELAHLRPGFWIGGAVALAIGALFTSSHLVSPLALATGCAPLLLLISLPSVLHARDAGTLELELTCRRSALQAMVDRLVAVILCASVTQTLISAALALLADVSFARSMLLWIGASALMLSGAVASVRRFRSGQIALISSGIWILLIAYADAQPRFAADLYKVNLAAWMICDALALALFIWILRR
ncbi:MAG: hypothetical protein OWT27_04955, partial [Firmicutes bacterium]|nr:hypothetical protein [Bacillota bacterium]